MGTGNTKPVALYAFVDGCWVLVGYREMAVEDEIPVFA